jgi:membrane protein DedA with SNARE-associated domain
MHPPEIPVWLNASKLANHPIAAFFIIFFGTWFSEDGAMLGSIYMWKQGKLAWPIIYWGNTLGVSVGDLLLYWVGFEISRGLEKPWVARFIKPSRLERGRAFFAKWGNWLTFMARFIPGLRVPGFSAAGLMRTPFAPFTAIVFLTAAFWIGIQMELADAVGNNLSGWQIFWLALALLILTYWVIKGFEDDNWRRRWIALRRLVRL